ncbi:MAG TPA: DinB family protein, partial [Longimicrobium sp.]|nr:DinB family protein [Longimicrobium sp.]
MSAETATAPSIKQAALGDLDIEMQRTRTLLERVPDDQLDWKPHPKSMALGSLALHITTIPYWIETIASTEYLDLAGMTHNAPPASRQEILDAFDQRTAAMRAALDRADDATLLGPWELRMGDKVMQRMPRVGMIRGMG